MKWKVLIFMLLWLILPMRVNAQEKIEINPMVKSQVYNGNVEFEVTVYSTNLQRVEYLVYSEGVVTQTGTQIINEFYKKNYSFILTVDAKKNNSNLVYVEVNAYDRDGSKYTNISNSIKIDMDKPMIDIQYDKNSENYYKSRIATITVTERNFSPKNCRFFGNTPSPSAWTSKGNVHKTKIKFNSDGEYLLQIECTDLAGNKSSQTSKSFVIDKTKPKIKIDFDKQKDKPYYAKNRTATITIIEKNLDKNKIAINGEWKKVGENYKSSYTFKKEGKYRIQLQCTDLAGNKSKKVVSEAFYIDSKKPKIQVTGIKNNKSYGKDDEVLFTIKADDTYYDHLVYTLNDTKKEIKSKSFSSKITQDGVYVLTAQVFDKSGQKSKKVKKTFTVNKNGSSYQLLQDDKVMVVEKNISKIVSKKLWITLNNQDYELKPDRDYKIVDSCKYVIDKKVFEKYGEGAYKIGVQSIDKAGNLNVYLPKEEILIDKTPPEGYFIGLDKTVYGLKQKKFSIGYKDNVGIKSLVLKINGEEVKSWNREELLEAKGEVSYLLVEDKKEREISFVLQDVAGISTTSEPIKVLITTDLWTRYQKIIIFFMLLSGVSLYIFRKNRT